MVYETAQIYKNELKPDKALTLMLVHLHRFKLQEYNHFLLPYIMKIQIIEGYSSVTPCNITHRSLKGHSIPSTDYHRPAFPIH